MKGELKSSVVTTPRPEKSPPEPSADDAEMTMELRDPSDMTPLDFTRFEKNQGFPPHNHYQDSNANMDSDNEGGIFQKSAIKK